MSFCSLNYSGNLQLIVYRKLSHTKLGQIYRTLLVRLCNLISPIVLTNKYENGKFIRLPTRSLTHLCSSQELSSIRRIMIEKLTVFNLTCN